MNATRLVIAEILRPRGNQGEVLARSQTDIPGRLETVKHAHVQLRDGSDVAIQIAHAWAHKDDWVLKFSGVDSIDAAERFRGADVWIPFSERGRLESGEFFRSDLVGCRVVDRSTGRDIGAITGWQQYGGPPLMEIEAEGRAILIPFVTELCEVDLGGRTVRVDVPEGLLAL